MIEWILQPWPWYIGGPLIGLMVPALLILTGKNLGVSSSFRHIGAICTPNAPFSYIKDHNWRDHSWNLIFIVGILIGGYIGNFLLSTTPISFLPDSFYSLSGVIKVAIGGILIGFGARYAGGCTSGHTIMGLANLNWPSLVASISFFVGGIITTWLLWPLLNVG